MYKRMACARELLKNGVPAKEAAERCGFGEYSTFYRGYEKMFNQSPSEPVTEEDGCRQTTN
jgi:AraC-like DNA-binding protein